MHTLLEYRAGKLTRHHQCPSASRMNRFNDKITAVVVDGTENDDDDDPMPMPTDFDHQRLESVQLIRRFSKKLQLHHIHATGHDGYAPVDTNQRKGDDEAAKMMMQRMMMDKKASSSMSAAASAAVRRNVGIGSSTSLDADGGSGSGSHFDNKYHPGSNLHACGRRLQFSSGQIGTSSASLNRFANGNLEPFGAKNRIHTEFSMNGSQQTTTTTSSTSFDIDDCGGRFRRSLATMVLTKSQSMPLHTTTSRNGLRKADVGIHLSFWQGVSGDEEGESDNDDRFFLKENAKDDAANHKDSRRARIVTAATAARDTGTGDSFAGVRWLPERAICGTTGTVRGMRHRVRAGIATFRQQTTPKCKNFHQLEAGKVVVYTTSAGIVRATFQQCLRVKTILSTLLVGFDEKDVFKCRAYQWELAERLRGVDVDGADDNIRIPQVFIEGYHLGNGEAIEQLNECGRLRKILRPYQRASANQVCHKCGGYLLLLCSACNGSKKSVTRNQFSGRLVPLRCIKCDECGLVPCDLCCCPTGGQ